MDWIAIIAAVLAVWNLIVFAVYGIDKGKAKRGARRVSERTLLTLALLMGGLGAFLGMWVFRHKTKHSKFKIGVPLLLALNIALAVLFIRGFDVGFETKTAAYIKISALEAKAIIGLGYKKIYDFGGILYWPYEMVAAGGGS